MRLLEFQAKRLFSRNGIPVPKGVLIESPDALEPLETLSFPVVLKAQVPVGGRGKAGGIRTVTQAKEAAAVAKELLASNIKGVPVQAVLAEEQAGIERELYLAILIDKQTNMPIIMASATGGVDIEEVTRENPEQVIKKPIEPFIGLSDYIVRYLGKNLGLGDYLESFREIVNGTYAIFRDCDASLVEINPLAVTPSGLLALDAKILLDEKAAFRHHDLFSQLRTERRQLEKGTKTKAEQLAEERGITYVPLDGDVGMISDGAGTGMLTLDLIQDAGGQAANFCELGGLAGAESMRQALEVVHANPNVKVVLISLIGGLTRMDEMADGIVQYLEQHGKSAPLIIRMYGTQEEVGKEKLRAVGIETFEDLEAAVRTAVKLAKES